MGVTVDEKVKDFVILTHVKKMKKEECWDVFKAM